MLSEDDLVWHKKLPKGHLRLKKYALIPPTTPAKYRQIRQDCSFVKRKSQTLENCWWFHSTTRHSCNFDHQSKQHLGWCHRVYSAYAWSRNTRPLCFLLPTDPLRHWQAVYCSFPGWGSQYAWISKKLWRLSNQSLKSSADSYVLECSNREPGWLQWINSPRGSNNFSVF